MREFARLAQLAHVTVLRIISGEKYLALDRLPGWLDLLQVEGAAREELRVEAIIAACPLQGQALIRELLERPRRRGVRRS